MRYGRAVLGRLHFRSCPAWGLALLALGCAGSEHKDPPSAAAVVPPASGAPRAKPATSAAAKPPASAAPAKPKPVDDAPRAYAKSRFIWVMPVPEFGHQWIGYLWSGGSVKLKKAKPVQGPGCPGWYAIEPRGYVCVDGERATLDKNDPVYQAEKRYGPDMSSPWPSHYGESRDLQRYKTIPDEKQERAREWDFEAHMKQVRAILDGGTAKGMLEGVDLTPAPVDAHIALPALPHTVYEVRNRLRNQSTVAWQGEVQKNGRTWLLSADYMWVPKDRVVPYPKVTFHGVHLGQGAKLPLAFFRGKDRPKYKKDGDGAFTDTGDKWKRLSWVELTGKSEKKDGTEYLETRDHGLWVKKNEAVVPTPQATTPWGAKLGEPDKSPNAPKGRRTWIEASVWGGWLIAYVDTEPVFVTMISPGRGGTPVPGKTALETASTPTGNFKITGKFITAAMVAPHEYIHSDVPWTQNFHGPHALHGAYWHNNWGQRMSGGCVNVSPIDGKWLFYFTEPELPDGWHGVRWEPKLGPATTFVVHR